MASPQGGILSATAAESRNLDDSVDSDSGNSYVSSDASSSDAIPCRWRNRTYYDQECARYFDCPSHILARHRLDNDALEELDGADRVAEVAEINIEHGSDNSVESSSLPPVQEPAEHLHGDEATSDDTPNSSSAPSASASTNTGQVIESVLSQGESASLPIRTSSTSPPAFSAPSTEPHNLSDELHTNIQPEIPSPHQSSMGSEAAVEQRREYSRRSSSYSSRSQRPYTHFSEFVLPRWQPDAEVTLCPICRTQFSIFVRKHHCRKCGRVVCNSCSPHRIIIPYQYIVRQPGSEVSLPPGLIRDGFGSRFIDANGDSGGERVRLCNPCVPDPNTAPPQSPTSPEALSPHSSHRRSRSNLNAYGIVGVGPATRGETFIPNADREAYRYYSPRSRSITMQGSGTHHSPNSPSSRNRASASSTQSPFDRFLAVGPSSLSAIPHSGARYGSFGNHSTSSRQRALPPPPQIAEEDECPICHRELPSQTLPNFESLRESHINACIQGHSTYGSPNPPGGGNGHTLQAAPRRTGMYIYSATEKDCIDDAECTICLEEFTVGISMARLECLCRFHRTCISAWFVNHPGRCPVHQHDGFGY